MSPPQDHQPDPLPVKLQALSQGEAHLWLADAGPTLTAEALARHAERAPSEERRPRASFRRAADWRRHVVARGLVRAVLSSYVARPPQDWRFVQGPHGRPELAPGEAPGDLRFNLSHAGDVAVCAVAAGRDIGVDVEALARAGDVASVASRVLTDAERADMASREGRDRDERLISYWTLKESVAKALGLGLSLDLTTAAFTFGPDGPRLAGRPFPARDAAGWSFTLHRPDPAHLVAAAAWGASPTRFHVFQHDA